MVYEVSVHFAVVAGHPQYILQEEWQWQLKLPGENNKTISRISKTLSPANIYRKEDWPLIISFFKPRIIALDLFWNAVKYSFEK